MVWSLVLIPTGFALLTPAFGRMPRVIGPAALGTVLTTLAASVWIAANPAAGAAWGWGPVLQLELEAAGFARAMAVLVPFVALPVILYALSAENEARVRLVALLVAFVGAMEMLVLAADFLTLLIGWEIVGALSWVLIGHGWRDPGNPRQAAHALITTRFGDLGLYVAAGVTFAATGELGFRALGSVDGTGQHVIAAGVLVAAAAKSAQVPFSPWLFAAMAGPTPVSALLHSATMVAAGAYLLIRLSPLLQAVVWFAPALVAVGLVTALAGGVVALLQTHAKRVLAASTSAQYGLMFVAVGAGSTAAAGVHLVAHALFKALLFLGAGVAIHSANTEDLRRMQLGRILPMVAALSAVGALALAAVPPLGAAWTKEAVVAAAVHWSPWAGGGALLAGSLGALYAARYHLLAYGGGGNPEPRDRRPASGETASLVLLAAGTLLLSALWLPASSRTVERFTGGELVGTGPVEVTVSTTLVVLAVGVAWWLWRAGSLVTLGLGHRASRAADWFGLPDAARRVVVDGVLILSRLLARFDDRVVDAGVRGAASIARLFSRLFSLRVEFGVDAAVRALAGATLLAARGSRVTDDRAVDGAVEGVARGIGLTGDRGRRVQTGLSHHYYLMVAGGLAVLVGVLAIVR